MARASVRPTLATWGIAELRKERVNLGLAAFVITVLSFYFSYVADAINRSERPVLLAGGGVEREAPPVHAQGVGAELGMNADRQIIVVAQQHPDVFDGAVIDGDGALALPEEHAGGGGLTSARSVVLARRHV